MHPTLPPCLPQNLDRALLIGRVWRPAPIDGPSVVVVRGGQVVVDLGRRMARILEVNETLGYCVVEPGVSFQAMHEDLARRGSKLMISPTAGPPQGSLLGNALDKGGGGGAYADHFGMSCGMEVVLGNGEIIRTGDGSLDAP